MKIGAGVKKTIRSGLVNRSHRSDVRQFVRDGMRVRGGNPFLAGDPFLATKDNFLRR